MAHCTCEGCVNKYHSSRWGKITAREHGWFISRSGVAHCPEHLPDWVKAWRIRKYRKHVAKSTPFACRTCGWAGTHPCVVGKVGSPVWLKQIPLNRWHSVRTEDLKKLKYEQAEEKTHHVK